MPNSIAASRTRRRTASDVPGSPLMARDAAVRETPARPATSSSFGRLGSTGKGATSSISAQLMHVQVS
jgi:hypothetical protein